MTEPATKTEIIPQLFYRDVPAALEWLGRAFGFVEGMRHSTPSGGMHAQMTLGGQRVMMGQGADAWRMQSPEEGGTATQGVFVYLPEVDAHFARAQAAGAEIVHPPRDEPYGRTYTARDLDGHPRAYFVPMTAAVPLTPTASPASEGLRDTVADRGGRRLITGTLVLLIWST